MKRIFEAPAARSRVLTRNFFQHLRIGRKLLHEHKKPFDCFSWFMSSESTANHVDLFKFEGSEQQFLTTRVPERKISTAGYVR